MSGDEESSVCAAGMSQMNPLQKCTIKKMYRVENILQQLNIYLHQSDDKTFMESLVKSLDKMDDILQLFLAYYEMKTSAVCVNVVHKEEEKEPHQSPHHHQNKF